MDTEMQRGGKMDKMDTEMQRGGKRRNHTHDVVGGGKCNDMAVHNIAMHG